MFFYYFSWLSKTVKHALYILYLTALTIPLTNRNAKKLASLPSPATYLEAKTAFCHLYSTGVEL